MEQNDFEDEIPQDKSKSWLKHADKSLSRLQNVKKTHYWLGGGPREREVDCKCDYRSKHPTSFVNMVPNPPQLSQESQETASNAELSIPVLVQRRLHDKTKSKPSRPKNKPRPYSATVCSVQDAPPVYWEQFPSENTPGNIETKNFIAVKGQTFSRQARDQYSAHNKHNTPIYKGTCILHLDPQHVWHVEDSQRATLEGLRKYSAFGQDETNPLPLPPRVSPELPGPPAVELVPLVGDDCVDDDSGSVDVDCDDDDDGDGDDDGDDDEEELLCLAASEPGENSKSSWRPGPVLIPTADLECASSDEEWDTFSGTSSQSNRALSADYVAKSGVFLDELSRRQTQEAQELSEMFSEMTKDQLKVDGIDLRSVLSSPARQTTTPTTPGEPSGFSVIHIGKDATGDSSYHDCRPDGSMWVEEPYIPRIRSDGLGANPYLGCNRFQSPPKQVQSAITSRRQEHDGFVLKGKTFELLDAKDLAVSGRLGQRSCATTPSAGHGVSAHAQKDEVVGKPPRPSKTMKPREPQRRASSGTTNSKHRKAHDMEEILEGSVVPHPPHPRNPRKSSLRKALSQGDVRCLSPEVIASVKKTVSFSDEVLDNPTRLLKQGKTSSTRRQEVIKPEVVIQKKITKPEIVKSEIDKPKVVTKKEITKQENDKPEVKSDVSKKTFVVENSCTGSLPASKDSSDPKLKGVIIDNGLEVKGRFNEVQESSPDAKSCIETPNKVATSSKSNLIAQIKQVTRCPCHDEGCHCRDITRPTKAVLFQSRAAKQQARDVTQKLLKQRSSRPTSAPIRRDVTDSAPVPHRSRIGSAQHKRDGPVGTRRTRPVSAHIKRPSSKQAHRSYNAARLSKGQPSRPVPPDTKPRKKEEEKTEQLDLGFVWGAGGDDVAASEECEQVYAKLQEKGINITMETVKRGLMAPARRASENCMATLSLSSSSGLLSRPEKWLPEEYARVKIWDNVLLKGK